MTPAYSKQAKKALDGMDRPTQQRIREGIGKIPEGDIKQIQGRKIITFRLRIGSWRVLYSFGNNDTILIEKIAPRGGAYKGV